jgi:hypothetical protein
MNQDDFNEAERRSKLRMQVIYEGAKKQKPWMVFNVGCIECGVSSDVVGFYATKEEADRVAKTCEDHLHWRQGGQNAFEVFDLRAPQAQEYTDVIVKMKDKHD